MTNSETSQEALRYIIVYCDTPPLSNVTLVSRENQARAYHPSRYIEAERRTTKYSYIVSVETFDVNNFDIWLEVIIAAAGLIDAMSSLLAGIDRTLWPVPDRRRVLAVLHGHAVTVAYPDIDHARNALKADKKAVTP